MDESDKFFLSQTREFKLDMLEDCLEAKEFGMFVQLAKVLLDATIGEGGIETEVIEELRIKHNINLASPEKECGFEIHVYDRDNT